VTTRAHRICVARIGAPHGVRGEVKVWPFTAEPLAIADYGPLETEDGSARFEIETLRAAKDHLVARLKGVADRDTAERLTNTDLFVRRDRLPPPDAKDEFYHADLIGAVVVDANGRECGSVAAIHNFGAGDLIEITPIGGGATVLLPFSEAAVPIIDIAARRIVVDAEAFAAAGSPAGEGEQQAK
jgi:16S rRNA processing protein RimM